MKALAKDVVTVLKEKQGGVQFSGMLNSQEQSPVPGWEAWVELWL